MRLQDARCRKAPQCHPGHWEPFYVRFVRICVLKHNPEIKTRHALFGSGFEPKSKLLPSMAIDGPLIIIDFSHGRCFRIHGHRWQP